MKKEVEIFNSSIAFLEPIFQNLPRKNEWLGFTDFGLRLFIDRSYCGLKSAQLILNNFQDHYDQGLGLIFRNIISDFFLVMNMTLYAPKSQEIDFLLIHYFKDGENQMNRFINRMETTGMYPIQMMNQIRANLTNAKTKSGLIRSEADPEIKPEMRTAEIFTNLLKHHASNDQIKMLLSHAFDLWKYYSQYEHYGISAYELTRNPRGEEFNSRIVSILKISFFSLTICLKNLSLEVEEQKLADYLVQEISV